MEDQEIWIPVINSDLNYEVSNLGNVKSYFKGGRILKPHITPNGYTSYTLYINKKYKKYSGHRLVALHFIPNPNNKKEVNHIDGDKLNNMATNLQWCTASENQIHAFKTGLQFIDVGYNNPISKNIICYYNGIETRHGSMTQASLLLGMSRSCMLRSIAGNRPIKTGKYKGYSFKWDT